MSSYSAQTLPDGSVQVRTKPTFILGPVGITCAIIVFLSLSRTAMIFFRLGSTIGILITGVLIWAFYSYLFRWGEKNTARKECTFRVDAGGITLASGLLLDRSDIASLHMTSPVARETTFQSGFVGGKYVSGASSTAGIPPEMAARSWRVEVEAKGNVHTLCGGLTEPVARAVLHEIGKVWS